MWTFLIINLIIQNTAAEKPLNTKNEDADVGYANLGQFPYFALVFHKVFLKCGGSIISNNFILTAGHCIYNLEASQIRLGVGIVQIPVDRTGPRHNASKIIVHPHFKSSTFENDIGLIRLTKPLVFNNNVNRILLTNMEQNPTTATVLGFALYIGPKYEVKKMKFGPVSMLSVTDCQALYQPQIFNNTICVGSYHGKVSLCPKDAGDPLVVDGKLFGFMSKFRFCGSIIPSLFIRVTSFRSWIIENTDLSPKD